MFFQFFKYGVGSIFTYFFLFSGVYVLTDIVGIKANISYAIILTATYILNYFLAIWFVFSKNYSMRSMILFAGYILLFWVLNNLFFNAFFRFTNLNYLFITLINIIIFAPIRFLTLRHTVFKS